MRTVLSLIVLIFITACSGGLKATCDVADDCAPNERCSDLGFCIDLEISERPPRNQDPEGEEAIEPGPCVPEPTYVVTMSASEIQLIDFECPNAELSMFVEGLGEARVLFEVQSDDPLEVLIFAHEPGTPTDVRLSFSRQGAEVANTLMTFEVNP